MYRFYPLVFVTAISLCGCEDSMPAPSGERQPANVPGIAPVGGLSELQQPESDPTPPPVVQPSATQPAAPKQGIIGKTTAKIVNAREATQNPKVVEVENKITGSDPITIAATAYVALSSKASALNFKNALNLHKATNDKNPTYDEFLKLKDQYRVEFAMLPPYQMYGYDETTGGIVILEDKAEKIRRYNDAGIPLDEADKQYVDAN